MKTSTKLVIIFLVVTGSLNISASLNTEQSDKTKALTRKWKYVMIQVPAVRQMLDHASLEERESIESQYAKALKNSYLKFNEDGTFDIRKAPSPPTKGTWRFDPKDGNKLYMKEDKDAKEQETYIQKLNRKHLVITNGKRNEAELVQIFLVPFE